MRRIAIALLASTLTLGGATAAQPRHDDLLSRIDHLVFATPDLDAGVAAIDTLLGVRATAGGQHPGLGTRNALVALGPSTYLEIIGPDPDQPRPSSPRRFGLDDLKKPTLYTWVAKGTNLDRFAADAAGHGVKLGAVIDGSRKRPDGVTLSWRYTDPNVVLADRLMPYFIDWGSSPHPSATAARGASLVSLRAVHPDAARVQAMLDVVGLGLRVEPGPKPALIATIDGPKGRVELKN